MSGLLRWLAVIAVLVAAFFAGRAFLGSDGSDGALSNAPAPNAPAPKCCEPISLTFVVEPRAWQEHRITLPQDADVTVAWESINRNAAGGAVGALAGTGRLGASEGSGGDVDVHLTGPGVDQRQPRSVRGSIHFDGRAGGTYRIRFSNDFSLITSKEVSLTWEFR